MSLDDLVNKILDKRLTDHEIITRLSPCVLREIIADALETDISLSQGDALMLSAALSNQEFTKEMVQSASQATIWLCTLHHPLPDCTGSIYYQMRLNRQLFILRGGVQQAAASGFVSLNS